MWLCLAFGKNNYCLINYLACFCLDLQVMFEGVTGSSFTGDIAIDDFEFGTNCCPLSSKLTTLSQLCYFIVQTVVMV